MPFRRLLPLVLLLGLSGCKPAPEPVPPKEETGATDSAVEKTLPLSPGIRAASLISGGIAGISNSIQITYDWKLVVISDDLSFIRPLDGEEQKKIHAALKPFRTLHYVLSNGVPDAFSSIIVSLGTGEGGGNRAGSCATR